VAAGRYRIPDICVVKLPAPDEQILTSAPYIVIEVLSPDDSFPLLQQRLDDYLAMGVPRVWILDSETGRVWHVTPEGHFEERDQVLRTANGLVSLPVSDLIDS